ncbi:MAG TPA: cupin domain-containing protein [Solirubrobacteraceae bacterium]
MVERARLESVASGLAPVSAGWFVVNAGDAAWVSNDRLGGVCIFESDEFVLRGRPDLEEYVKPGAGFVIRVVSPGQPTGGFHAESVEEDFLVIQGECVLIVEDEEVPLRAWDFVHCPPGTAHTFVGAGDGPCVLVCAGNRDFDDETFWRESRASEIARRHGVSGDAEPSSRGSWRVERPSQWPELPWS